MFNWLYARRHHGIFILRIEDTDIARSSDEMVGAILEGLAWLGITCDEGPFFQTRNREEHLRGARALLDAGRAYRCFCTVEALEERRRVAEKAGRVWKYDRSCEALTADQASARELAGEACCVRLRVPEGMTVYEDLVHGRTAFSNVEIEDLVLVRSDGTPTYNLSCVKDDIAMRVTHVIRGDDHISNTPKQILLYEALGSPAPRFGHLPLILGEDKKRLSKRHGAVSVLEYRRTGHLPGALFNFLALLGWSPGNDREVMSVAEMTEAFSFEGVGKKSAVFDNDKLQWMNGEYLKAMPGAELLGLVRPSLEQEGLWQDDLVEGRRVWFTSLLSLLKDRSRLVGDLARDARPFLSEEYPIDPAAAGKHLGTAEAASRLERLFEAFSGLTPFDEATCEKTLRELAASLGIKAGDLIHPARVALTGRAVSPGIFAVMVLMGKAGVLARLARVAAQVRNGTLPPLAPTAQVAQ